MLSYNVTLMVIYLIKIMKSFSELVQEIETLDFSTSSSSDFSSSPTSESILSESCENFSDSISKSFKLSETDRRTVIVDPYKSYNQNSESCKKKKLKRWTAEEDSQLLELFYQFGNNWDEIAENMPGRAASGVKNRFYWICKSPLPASTVQKIKQASTVQKLYKAPKSSSELFRKINNYIREEFLIESFLALDKPSAYSDLVYKLKMTPQDLENHARMQGLLEKAQQLYISCEKAKQNLASLQKYVLYSA